MTQAPAYFQRFVQQVLEGLNFAFGYLDDILVFSSSIEEHLKHVRILFERLRMANLKLTARKCSFLKKHVQYLGHLISGEGIEPVPEKLKDLKEMAPPKTQKEVRRFLGFTGYYRKFIPRFSDIARPLTNLTKKDVDFEWTKQCQDTFEMMKEMLLKEPILKYPDPNYGYILYTDASKYAWAGVLTQEYHYTEGGKIKIIHHPITYVSGLFRGPQINWAALTKEAYAIYMSARKLTHYFRDSKILLRSDHLPLKKFLLRNTKNDMVNNWAMELQQFTIEFEYIEGIKNTLADTMSHLVHITPEIEKEPELPDQEFGKYVFEKLDPVLVEAVFSSKSDTREPDISKKDMSEPIPKDLSVEWPLTLDQLRKLQIKDSFCKKTIKRVMTDTKDKKMSYPYFIRQGVLNRYVQDGKQRFETRVVPQACADNLLRLAHDDLGHNGSARTYMLLRQNYYWKGMKPQVYKYVKRCSKCQHCNAQVVKYQQGQFSVPKAPMDFISMDLIGEFQPPTSEGYKYALTVICMLTGFTWCVPLKTKKAEEIVKAYMKEVYYGYGGSRKILSDNGSEFTNDLFKKVAEKLGVEHKIYSPPYHPQSNGRIEGYHQFLKACLAKHTTKHMEWMDVIPLACAAYNFFPNEHSRESPFFLMFGRDPRIPLTEMFTPKIRYLGNDECVLSLEALTEIYHMVAQNLKLARERMTKTTKVHPPTFTVGDMVLLRNHTRKGFEPRFKDPHRVLLIKGNQVQIVPKVGGDVKWAHISDV
ncbi:MAG: DDE-type integrase/transposase/recombinase, partial [Proteobacteria bacterium]|nr:DDE-type integrase/transposase/recombinase [Pseudomonadota bacterium]